MKRKANKRIRPQHFKGDHTEYLLHPTKGFRRMKPHQREAKRLGEAKLDFFKRAGKQNG